MILKLAPLPTMKITGFWINDKQVSPEEFIEELTCLFDVTKLCTRQGCENCQVRIEAAAKANEQL